MRSPCNAHAEDWKQRSARVKYLLREWWRGTAGAGMLSLLRVHIERSVNYGELPTHLFHAFLFHSFSVCAVTLFNNTPTLYLRIHRLPASTTTAALDLPCPPPPLAPCVSRRGILTSAVCITLSSASGALIGARHGCCPKRTAGWTHQCGRSAERYERRNERPGSLPIEVRTLLAFFLSFFCVWASERGVHAGMLALRPILFVRVGWHHMRIALLALHLRGSVTSTGSAGLVRALARGVGYAVII
ncbi:hypothetical protein B0H13DRAFT_2309332 [Mycena leptocephala]|nr:hypothetical protein B0H13DRAFT_2309332 [Mycena leptocephala]